MKFDLSPRRFAIEVSPLEASAVVSQRAEQRAFLVRADAGLGDIGEQGPRRIEQQLPALLSPGFGAVQEIRDAIGFQVADA